MLSDLWYKRLIAFTVAIAMFMEALDSTIINTAIPAMAHSLQANPIDLKIALISYLLSLAIFIPISGWIADKFGAKSVFMLALIIFTISSLWCGLTNNLWELVMARTLQGIGGSLALPVGRLILLRTFARHEMIAAMNLVVMVAALGMMLGPLLGGLLTHYFSWRWIFFMNIPVGIIAFVLANYWLKTAPKKIVPRLDKLGFILFGSSLALFTFGLSTLSETNVNHTVATLIIISAIGLFLCYIYHSRSQLHPIVNTALLHLRTFQVSITGNLTSRLGFGAIPFLVPLMLQLTLNYLPQMSGLLLAPTALGVLVAKSASLRILRLLGYKRLLIINTFMASLVLCLFALVNAQTSIYYIIALTFSFGLLTSLQYTGMNSIAYADVSEDHLSAATSIMSTLQQLTQSFGVAVSAILLRHFAGGTSQHYELTVNVFHHTFITLGIITLLSIVGFARLKPNDGQQMILSK